MKKALRITIFLLITVLWLGKVYDVLRWKDTHGDYLSSVSELAETPKDSIDVVFVGSSHVYAGIYPSYLWTNYGIAAFDLAISGMDRDSAYYYLKHMFKTQSPKVAVVDVFPLTYEKHAVPGNIYRNYLSLPYSVDTLPALESYAAKDPTVSENMLDYLARWPIIHTRYRELQRRDFVNDEANLYARGEYLNWESNKAETIDPGEPDPLLKNEDQEKWLKELKALCDANDCRLILMALPFLPYDDDQRYIDYAGTFAQENGIDFYDFNRKIKELDLNYESDFYDDSHLNAYGAKKVSLFFGKEFSERFGMSDHRGDAAYALWEQDLRYYEHRRDGDSLAIAEDLPAVTELLSRMPEVTAVISLEGSYENADFYESLRLLPGMTEEDYRAGGKWLWENGSLSRIMANDPAAPAYVKDLDPYATLRVQYTADFTPGNIRLGSGELSNKSGELRIIVYDSFLHNFLTVREFSAD
ncbi:MAG: hypothetical protein K6E50_04530 [Lachnospiraceae bacterium]|nr:hypothetical protein [Lachnospiraceae bacterium]